MNKTILITGASQGLGKSLAYTLAAQGHTVLLVARSHRLLDEIKIDITAHNGKAETFVCNITKLTEVKKLVQDVFEKYTSIDVLINNAGIWTDDEIEKKDTTQRFRAIETNIIGQINITEELLPRLKKQKSAVIFNVISTAGVPEIPAGDNRYWKTYGASKWGFTGYTHALRESLRETNIKVIQFFPGGFESNLYDNAKRPNAHSQPWMMKTQDVTDIAVFALTRPVDVYIEKIVVSKKIHSK